ncbi:MAG: PadR family transcriptional regulator [Actinomycetota bacterium]|nr:PadR family transcriptional regulator [Actinomycetota bacterium]
MTPTARVILGMLRLGARTGYEIKQATDVSTRFFWGASYGQIYPELRKLEEAGLVTAAADAPGGRRRRAYELTEAGDRALRDWLVADEPLEFSVRDEGLLKVFFGDVGSRDELVENVRRLRRDHESRLAHFREIQARVEGRDSTVRALEYGIAFLEWNVRWWRGVEQELESP